MGLPIERKLYRKERGGVFRSILRRIVLAVSATLCVSFALVVDCQGATLLGNSTEDNLVAGDGLCTLREAILNANSDTDTTLGDCPPGGGADLVILPTGTITLALDGTGEDTALTGDLDISDDLTIRGEGADTSIVSGAMLDRVFEIRSAGDLHVSFEAMTIRDGRTPSTGLSFENGGGGILVSALPGGSPIVTIDSSKIFTNDSGNGNGGGISMAKPLAAITNPTLDLVNSQVSGNTASQGGGGIHCAGCTVTVVNSVISDNIAMVTDGIGFGGGGLSVTGNAAVTHASDHTAIRENVSGEDAGGILFGGMGTMTVSDSTLSSNEASGNGGGLSKEITLAGGTLVLTGLDLTDNSADRDGDNTGDGGAAFLPDGTLTMASSRIVGNTDRSGGNGLFAAGGYAATENNWWGCNAGPGGAGCDPVSGVADYDPWLVLIHHAVPGTVYTNQTAALIAEMTFNSDGDDTTALGTLPDGIAILFNNPVLGAISILSDTQLTDGVARGVFSAGATSGVGSADATVDNQTITAPIIIEQAPTPTPTVTHTPTPRETPSATATTTHIETPSETPSPSLTPASTATRDFDTEPTENPDGTIDARDLLHLFGEVLAGSDEGSVVFDFGRHWMNK